MGSLHIPALAEPSLVMGDAQQPAYAKLDQIGRETALVVAFTHDVAQAGRRIALGWLVAGNDDSGLRASALGQPRPDIESQNAQSADEKDQQTAIVAKKPADALGLARLVDQTFGETDGNGQSLAARQRLSGFEPHAPRSSDLGAGVTAARAGRTGEMMQLELLFSDCCRQADVGAGLVDREFPAQAGDVPVQLVMIVEKTKLAVGSVADGEVIFAASRQQ